MFSFLQFTRSTLWGEFAWVVTIIFKGNFMMRTQFSGRRGQFSSGVIVGEAIYLGDNFPGGNHPGGNFPGEAIMGGEVLGGGAIFLGGNCPDTVLHIKQGHAVFDYLFSITH